MLGTHGENLMTCQVNAIILQFNAAAVACAADSTHCVVLLDNRKPQSVPR